MFTASIVAALTLQLLLALFVYVKYSSKLRNRSFVLLALALFAWSLLNVLNATFDTLGDSLLVMRLIMLFVVAQNAFFVLFSWSLLEDKIRLTRKAKIYLVLTVITALLTVSPVLFTGVAYNDYGPYPVAGPGMLFFIIQAFTSVYIGFRNLIRAYRKSRSIQRRQITYIFIGSAVLWGIVPITNFILALTLQTSFFVQFSPIYGFAFSFVIGTAIVRHHLFDLRMLLARSLAYLLTFAVFIVLYVSIVFGLAYMFFRGSNISLAQQLLYISLSLVFAPTLLYLKRFFDRVTNRFFYHDKYDPQSFLDEFNTLLTSSYELNTILEQSRTIIERTFKPTFVRFFLEEDDHTEKIRIVSGEGKRPDEADQKRIIELLENHKRSVFVTDELQEGGESVGRRSLYRALDRESIAVVIRLATSQQHIGFLLLGIRHDGAPFSRMDIRLLEIIGDELAIAIQSALRFDQIERFNETLQGEVEDATRRLRHTNDKLKALDETKDEFISMASHQLRTPLTSVKGYLSMVLEGDAGKLNEQQTKLLTQAFISSQRMVYLISDLLNVSRLRTGKFIIEKAPTDLPEVIAGELDQLYETAEARGLKLSFDRPKDFPLLSLDETKVRQVIMNFIDNAIYYTPAGGNIRIELEARKAAVEFRVVDDGIGVPKAEQHHLFSKFYRADNAKRARPDGTGLGLFMARKVVAAQGGSVIFKSVEGKGSTFGFTFPRHDLEIARQP